MGTVVHRDAKDRIVLVEGSEVVTDPDERRGDRGLVSSGNPQEDRYGKSADNTKVVESKDSDETVEVVEHERAEDVSKPDSPKKSSSKKN